MNQTLFIKRFHYESIFETKVLNYKRIIFPKLLHFHSKLRTIFSFWTYSFWTIIRNLFAFKRRLIVFQNPILGIFVTSPSTTFAKPLLDVSKIQVFVGQNFQHYQECVHTLLDMHGVVFTLTAKRPDFATPAKQLEQSNQVNKVCHHTLLSTLSNKCLDVYFSYKEANEICDPLFWSMLLRT